MQISKRLELSSLSVYLPAAVAIFSSAHVLEQGEPFGLALLFALLAAGVPPLFPALFFALSSLVDFELTRAILYGGQALLLSLAFSVKEKFFTPRGKNGFLLPFVCYLLALASFVLLSPFNAYPLPFSLSFLNEPIVQKTAIAFLLTLLAPVLTAGSNALLKKALKCRLQTDELIFLAIAYLLVGAGFCRLFGGDTYMGVCLFALLLASHLTKDASPMLLAFLFALPPLAVFQTGIERFFLYGAIAVLFTRLGRLCGASALLGVFLFFAYLDGVYAYPTGALLSRLLSALLPILLFIALPQSLLTKMENALIFYKEKHLTRVAVNRNRTAVGERLFEISALFREIQSTFTALGSGEAEQGAKQFVANSVENELCKKCSGYGSCRAVGFKEGLAKIIEIGSVKGKVSMIDMPVVLSRCCGRQSDLLYALNARLTEYRRYMMEAENAACGRQLLADQARGVSEMLKNLALEQSEPLPIGSSQENAYTVALAKAGILASEVLVYGEASAPTVSLVTFGSVDAVKLAKVTSAHFGMEFSVAEKITLGKNKFCCLLRKKPRYDAAFGVAHLVKSGERQSGDTHSTLRIDEKKFLVALSDGMGSGEYASLISERTVSLLESFYRSKMPPPLILSTINKLLTFSKEESFACVDIAVVDLEAGSADIIKIGSPMGFILSDSSLKILESESLPLGILENVHPTVATYPLQENDTLLFLSDGITDAFSSSGELYDYLKTVPASNPQRLAEELLSAALTRYNGVAKDDMSALAVRIFRA